MFIFSSRRQLSPEVSRLEAELVSTANSSLLQLESELEKG